MPQKKETFESALDRIEQIAAKMEAGDLPLGPGTYVEMPRRFVGELRPAAPVCQSQP